MQAFAQLIQESMDRYGYKPADLARASGLSRQHVSTLLKDDLREMPKVETLRALQRAFPMLSVDRFILAAASSLGLPVGPVEHGELSNEALLLILRERLDAADGEGGGSSWSGDPSPEDPTRPDEGLPYLRRAARTPKG